MRFTANLTRLLKFAAAAATCTTFVGIVTNLLSSSSSAATLDLIAEVLSLGDIIAAATACAITLTGVLIVHCRASAEHGADPTPELSVNTPEESSPLIHSTHLAEARSTYSLFLTRVTDLGISSNEDVDVNVKWLAVRVLSDLLVATGGALTLYNSKPTSPALRAGTVFLIAGKVLHPFLTNAYMTMYKPINIEAQKPPFVSFRQASVTITAIPITAGPVEEPPKVSRSHSSL